MAAAWDLLVRVGTFIDPAQSISARRLRTRHVIRAGRRLPATHADQL
jgi:hypothetical protein